MNGSEERDRLAEFRDALDRMGGGTPPGSPQQLVQVYDGGSIPTSVPAVFMCHAASIDCDESEGASGSITPDTAEVFPVLVLGPQVPVAGDNLVATVVGGRWVAQGGGGGGLCLVSFDIRSCLGVASLPLGGATVSVWEDSSKAVFLASGVTDGFGALDLAVGAGSRYVEVSKSPRWATLSATVDTVCGELTTLTPVAASGYHCTSVCRDPLKDTLTFTSSGGFAATLTRNFTGTWVDPGASVFFKSSGRLDVGAAVTGVGCTDANLPPATVACPPSVSITYNAATCPGPVYTITE